MSAQNGPSSGSKAPPPARVVCRALNALAEVPAQQWNALIPALPGRVFLRHEWLDALEQSGCVGENTGWIPQHLVLSREHEPGNLLAALPLYLKYHSYGEYVFDWAWADAYQRSGMSYYPKLLSAIPFTPAAGPRFLGDSRYAGLVKAGLEQIVVGQKLSSAHILLPDASQDGELGEDSEGHASHPWMQRKGVQFHWFNQGFRHFEDFLNSLSQPKRKKIRAERRKAEEAGVSCRWRSGSEITREDWQFFMRCYIATYRAHHSDPYLNFQFFERAHEAMPEAFVMIIASAQGHDVGASLLIRDQDRLYGRHWGSVAHVPFMHFEVAYYQSIEYAIEHGCQVIEGGAQGEHKMARGFLPVEIHSWHYLRDTRFADAVENFLGREGNAIEGYIDELNERNPFKAKP